jgi:hypothetical protein
VIEVVRRRWQRFSRRLVVVEHARHLTFTLLAGLPGSLSNEDA